MEEKKDLRIKDEKFEAWKTERVNLELYIGRLVGMDSIPDWGSQEREDAMKKCYELITDLIDKVQEVSREEGRLKYGFEIVERLKPIVNEIESHTVIGAVTQGLKLSEEEVDAFEEEVNETGKDDNQVGTVS